MNRLTTKQAEVENRRLAEEKLFNEFWLKYPKKTDKDVARKAFSIAIQKASHAKIMAGLALYNKFNPDIICNPSAWLNQRKWNGRTCTH